VSVHLVVHCNGTPEDRPEMGLEACRAFLPTRATTVDEARVEAIGKGWAVRQDPETWPAPSALQDICPACVHAIRKALDV